MQRFQKIGIITYQAPHLKTEQVLNRLLTKRQFCGGGGGGRFSGICSTFLPKRGASSAVCA